MPHALFLPYKHRPDSQDCGVFVYQPHSPSSSWQGAELDDNVASKTTMAQAGA